jgi:hypothetical protein
MSFRETAPFVWTSGAERIQALVADGRPVMLGFGMAPPAAFLPQPWRRSAAWLTAALLIALAVLAITALSSPAAAIARRVYVLDAARRPARSRLYTATRLAAMASLAMTILVGFVLVYLSSDLSRMSDAWDGWILSVELGSWIVFPGSVWVGIWNLSHVWKNTTAFLARVASVAFLASCCVLFWAAVAYHLLNVGMQY